MPNSLMPLHLAKLRRHIDSGLLMGGGGGGIVAWLSTLRAHTATRETILPPLPPSHATTRPTGLPIATRRAIVWRMFPNIAPLEWQRPCTLASTSQFDGDSVLAFYRHCCRHTRPRRCVSGLDPQRVIGVYISTVHCCHPCAGCGRPWSLGRLLNLELCRKSNGDDVAAAIIASRADI